MTITGVTHVALTVRDLGRSKDWYGRVLDWQPVMEGDGDGVSVSVGALPDGTLIGLRQYDDGGPGAFDPTRIGLDHLALGVESPEQLTSWQQRFVQLGVTHDAPQETPYGHVLNFKDPDGIALEIYAALATSP
jgi:glyoxylase I family protein